MNRPAPARRLAFELARVIADERVLRAVAAVPRERFVPFGLRERAYENESLPIGHGQTISQPYVVARMLELLALTGRERVLDVGTGSGYHAALLGRLAGEVVSIERDARLSATAAEALAAIGVTNVVCLVADGWAGLPAEAPFDAINVAATPGPAVPRALVEQLAVGGRLVVPLGGAMQVLTRLTRTGPAVGTAPEPDVVRESFEPVRFVPLTRPRPAGRGGRA